MTIRKLSVLAALAAALAAPAATAATHDGSPPYGNANGLQRCSGAIGYGTVVIAAGVNPDSTAPPGHCA
jgi:hypothetical protein